MCGQSVLDKVFVDKVCVDKVWRRAEEEKAEEEPGIQNQRCGEKQQFFFGRRPLPFDGSHLRLPSGPAGIRTTTGSLSALARDGKKTTKPQTQRGQARKETKRDQGQRTAARVINAAPEKPNMMGGPGGDRIPHQPAKRPPQNRSKWEQIILWRSKDEGTGSNTIEPKARGEEEEEEGRYV